VSTLPLVLAKRDSLHVQVAHEESHARDLVREGLGELVCLACGVWVGLAAVPGEFSIAANTLRIGDLVFEFTSDPFDARRGRTREGCFLMYKPPGLIRQLDDFLRGSGFEARTVFELGIWQGGSTAFWFEYLRPDKHVAIDLLEREDSSCLRSYVSEHKLEDRLKTYWGVDQADGARLREIVNDEFSSGLDLVVDDASHQLDATRASFDALFPLLRPGGVYLIEDWAWEHLPSVQAGDHPWAGRRGLVELVGDLVELTVTAGGKRALEKVTVYSGFVAVQRKVRPVQRGDQGRSY
jgi:hypothetical protein